ncbi:uncharacterized protein ARMOST_17792 [Armillaria ostoyae]|uniref:Uncharacterized protein n=1 Tax=Armillaria ostoyae TaxID=47428 RepID=A0A284S053_ARMOS|nr:uncharacterized protein ARMOST_17792 [Armillaria ostoyae]
MFSECQGCVTGIQCVTDVSRFVRQEENNPSVMDDAKESLFVDNVVGALSAMPCNTTYLPTYLPTVAPVCAVTTSSFSAPLPGLRFTFAYNPDAQNPHYLRMRTFFQVAVAGMYGLPIPPEQE